jgi:peptidoglycan/LPS O-acetylase OafA/YrhL
MSDGKRVLSLDVLRGIAILLVIFVHNPVFPEVRPWPYAVFPLFNRIGWMGVDLFFVLSGFLVGGLLLKELEVSGRIRAGRFIVRRAFKIWPTYYLFIVVYCSFQVAYYGRPASDVASHFWPNFLHVQNYFSSTEELGWLWSLGVEEHFYLALPLLLSVYFARGERHVPLSGIRLVALPVGVLGVGLALRGLTFVAADHERSPFALVFPSHLRFDSLFTGVFLAYLVTFRPDLVGRLRASRFALLVAAIGLSLVPGAFPSDGQLFLYPFGQTTLTLGFGAAVLYAHLVSTTPARASRVPKSLAWLGHAVAVVLARIGVFSYSIYVWHGFWCKPIANRLTALLGLRPAQPGIGFFYELVYWTVPIVVGAVAFHLVETPFLRLRERLVPKEKGELLRSATA